MNIVPFGEECYTCESIDKKFNKDLRNVAFPFDYVGHTFIESLTKKIYNLMFNDERLTDENIEIKLFGNDYFFIDNKYNFNYWHDTTHKNINEFAQNEIYEFIEKYNRRYDRLKTLLNSSEKILIISVNHYDNIYNKKYKKNELHELYNILKHINNNISLLAFNYDDNNFAFENLNHIVLNINYNLNFEESKKLFQIELFNYINLNL